jgi:hypothetical protein
VSRAVPRATRCTLVTDAGAVNVLFTCPAELVLCAADDDLWTQDSPAIGGRGEGLDEYGFGLASGRFGSGRQRDLVVCAPNEDVAEALDAGTATIIYGRALDGLASEGSQVWTQNSPGVPGRSEEGDHFGGWI